MHLVLSKHGPGRIATHASSIIWLHSVLRERGYNNAIYSGSGKLAEGWDANTGLRASCPNFQPKNNGPKVRTHFGSGFSGSSGCKSQHSEGEMCITLWAS